MGRTWYSSAPEEAAFQDTVIVLPEAVALTFLGAVASGAAGQSGMVTDADAAPSSSPLCSAVTVIV